MDASFDTAASNYDATFTNTIIGKLQRDLVYNQLSKVLENQKPKTILEINCGTGEDAIWLAKQKFTVTATDISEKMIAVSKSKKTLENVEFRQMDINSLNSYFSGKNFDLLFSNFGGLNCLSKTELQLFFKNATQLLTETGQIVLVIMPKNTLWEQFYFLAKGNFKNIFRRKKDSVIANVDGEKVVTHYYNPKETINLAAAFFNVKGVYPIGFFIPPSYLEPFLKNKSSLVSIISKFENKVKNNSFLSKYADHYLIVFQKK